MPRARAFSGAAVALATLLVVALDRSADASSGTVPDDFRTIQAALDQAQPGDVIQVKEMPVPYFEKLEFVRSGDATAGFISLEAFPGHSPVLDGTAVSGSDMVLIDSKSYVRVRGLEIRNNLDARDGSGVRVLGAGSHIELLDNVIHDIRGRDAMGITVYGTSTTASISDLLISGNQIYDCEPARSEALTLNGNVEHFVVEGNVVRDVNNIGIDFIGGETDINPDPALVARDGVCRFNQVYRANSIYGGGYGAGIYVDGGRDIVIENNIVAESDLGIEIGAENAGVDATGIVVRNNLVFRNDKVGIVFGGYDASVGRVRDSWFLNNTCFGNDTFGEGLGELWIQYAENNVVRNNIFFATSQNVLVYSEGGNVGNALDDNLFFAPGGAAAAEFTWQGTFHAGWSAYQTGSGQDASSLFSDPQLVDPATDDLHLVDTSPAVDRGDPTFVPDVGEVDIDGEERVAGGRVDIGADEWQAPCVPGDLDVVTGLLGVEVGATGSRFAWQPLSDAGGYHLNSVTAKESLDAAGPHRPPKVGGVAIGECDATVPTTECVDADALTVADDLLFYQVLATCQVGGEEGPAE